jgi:hypothetical protein
MAKAKLLPIKAFPRRGRETEYDPSMNEAVFRLSLLGLKDTEISEFYGISEKTLNAWKKENPDFLQSLEGGRKIADANVAHSLYRRATGMVTTKEVARRMPGNPDEFVVEVTKTEIAPDTVAASRWLGLRQRDRWSENLRKTQDEKAALGAGEQSVEGATASLSNMTEEELDMRIRELTDRHNRSDDA